jgi:hypothetical protein
MRQPARAERRCRRCPFCAPSGRCLERTIKSGRCGDWIWFVRYGKQVCRPYVRPRDPRTPAQLRSRARLSAASRKYGNSLTEKQRDACIAAGAKLRSRPRLGQSGPLTGQQYSIRKQFALQKAHGNGMRTATALQVLQPQKVKPTTWEPRRGASRVSPERRRLDAGRGKRPRRASKSVECGNKKERPPSQTPQIQAVTRCAAKPHPSIGRAIAGRIPGPSHNEVARPGRVWYNACVTSNTITIRLRRPRAEIEAKAKPNLNAWVNQLIEQAIGPRSADWNEHFDRASSGRKFRYSSQVKRAER